MTYDYSWSVSGADAVEIVWGALIVAFCIMAAIGIVFYVFHSIALFCLGKRRGIPLYGLAWVPVANMWLLGSLAEQYDNAVGRRGMKFQVLLPIYGVICYGYIIAAMVLYAGLFRNLPAWIEGYVTPESVAVLAGPGIALGLIAIALIVFAVFYFIALYKVYCASHRETAVVFEVLSILFGLQAFFLFADRNKDSEEMQQAAQAEQS